MIPGIIASQLLLIGEQASVEEAIASIDFVNGTYTYLETPYSADQVVNRSDLIIPGIGLLITDNSALRDSSAGAGNEPAELIGPFRDYLLGLNFTLVIEYIRADAFTYTFFLIDGNDDFAVREMFAVEDGGGGSNYVKAYDEKLGFPGDRDLTHTPDAQTAQQNFRRAIAVTRTPQKIVLSVDGAGIDEIVEDYTDFAASHMFLGGWHSPFEQSDAAETFNDHTLFLRLSIYPPQENSVLPGLSEYSGILPEPVNDDFANATIINLGETKNSYNYQATAEVDEPDHKGETAGLNYSVWYKYEAEFSGDVTIDLTGSGDFNGQGIILIVYTGTTVDDLTEVARDEFEEYPNEPVLTFTVSLGIIYYICVAGWEGGVGPVVISLIDTSA